MQAAPGCRSSASICSSLGPRDQRRFRRGPQRVFRRPAMVGIRWSPECRRLHERTRVRSRCDTRRALRATRHRAGQPAPPPPAADPSPLTRREREAAALVAKGLSNRKIADELMVSPRTVASTSTWRRSGPSSVSAA
ncbi:LuxR C-terminal-related transcriptional regulator [Streptomyces sp. NPDC091215]|uniref:LuxR C-terminal-related transcriptional regulator n=1 Tax=Streptomyces sp. NPDC091215 TaxID=3155192 RepID=UPI00343C9B92